MIAEINEGAREVKLADAYILTLRPQGDPGLLRLIDELTRMKLEPHIVRGIHGGKLSADEYFYIMVASWQKFGYILSPSEVGCTLGHKMIYERIVASGAQKSFVFEDDVELRDLGACLPDILRALGGSGVDFLHLGGMDGLSSRGALFGRKIEAAGKIYQIEDASLPELYRTCGYAISLCAAQKIASELTACTFRIDDFSTLSQALPAKAIFYWPVVGHPSELDASSIQRERESLQRPIQAKPLLWRLYSEIRETYRYRRDASLRRGSRSKDRYVNIHSED